MNDPQPEQQPEQQPPPNIIKKTKAAIIRRGFGHRGNCGGCRN